jgi:hypothetical protein
MQRTCAVLVLGLLVFAPAPRARAGESTTTGERATVVDLTRSDLERRLGFLASATMEGRETTQLGAHLAAEYVARQFELAGLEPLGDDGTWFQHYVVPRPTLGAGNELAVTVGDETLSYEVERGWNPFSVTSSGAAEGDAVFAGYGIASEARGWDDFAGLDVKGKVVLVLRKDPGWNDAREAAFLKKLSNAAERGAAALLLCNNPDTTRGGPDRIGHWSAMLGAPAGSGRIPYAFVSQEVAQRMLAPLGVSLDDLETSLRKDGPRSAALEGVRVRVRTALGKPQGANAANVVGFLRGRDPAVQDEVVVLGAHYDHVGRGYFGSLGGAGAAGEIHYGADDNGSGSVTLMELAEHFGSPANRPRRSLLFLAFSGEEMGLLGSAYYVEHPVLPLENVVAMLNMDMVGRSRDGKLEVGGVGTGAGLRDVVARANDEIGLSITWDPQGEAPSDSTSFFRKKIPVLFFFTGMHEDYHRPTDTADRINYDDMLRVARLVRATAVELGDQAPRLAYTDPPPVPRPPRLGIQLAPEEDPRGLLVGGVQPDGPAAEAGLQGGDVIVSLAGQIVRNAQDLRTVLVRLKPGKAVELVVLRGEERVTLQITPAERRGR